MEMKAPSTTAQPQPPSGGVYTTGPAGAGGMSAHAEDEEEEEGTKRPDQVHRDQDSQPVGGTEQRAGKYQHRW